MGRRISTNETRFDKEDENMISRALIVLVIISSFSVTSILQLSPKVMAQVHYSEGARVLVDDIIEALNSNDISRAQIHLNILNQQLPILVNSTSLEQIHTA